MSSEEPRSAARRLTRKGKETRDRIVSLAAEVMFERGVAGTTTEQVQILAGISPSQIYHYFTDKRALVSAVIDHQTATVLSFQEEMLATLDSIEALEAWRDVMVDMQQRAQCRGGCPIGSLAGELADVDEDFRVQIRSSFDRWESAIRRGLTAMQQRSELGADEDPASLALALLTGLQGGLLMTQTRRDTAALEAVLDAVIDRIRLAASLLTPPSDVETKPNSR